ncbi:MAG TPA: HPr family phosphocarrier protein [Rhodobiaceae bacterium]|nr:HPr family phosphocarrier protein [Rhodobiaceae bacterium]
MVGPPASTVLTLSNQRGLHARASAQFVRLAESFNATVSVSKDGETVHATSIMGLMMLGAACGTQIKISATGIQADAAIAALAGLVSNKFGED